MHIIKYNKALILLFKEPELKKASQRKIIMLKQVTDILLTDMTIKGFT